MVQTVTEMDGTMNQNLKTRIEDLIKSNRIVVFMKGNKERPQCGFSKTVVGIVKKYTNDFVTVDVLSDPDIREGIKEYSQWPTLPQLYIDQEFVGGCDIVVDLDKSGELSSILQVGGSDEAPTINFSPKALEELTKAAGEMGEGECIRLNISAGFEYQLSFDEPDSNDFSLDLGNGMQVIIDHLSASRANGLTIDFVSDKLDSGFSFENPNDPQDVADLTVEELRDWQEMGQEFLLIDVRPKHEWQQAHINFAKRLEDMSTTELDNLDKNATIVFHCHHGRRSKQMAESYRAKGFTNVYNLAGGVDAWARSIDTNVPTY